MLSAELVEGLLHEGESESLDFKREQYAFTGADADAKSELLKDILAFVNSWRRADAYILIGVEERPGFRARPVGVSEHLEDAALQQFVSSKTQKPVRLSYERAEVDDVSIGVICIPVQERPRFLRKDFGRLKASQVYIRHSSTTTTADPDEVASMGMAAVDSAVGLPDLEVFFYDPSTGEAVGSELCMETQCAVLPPLSRLPDYRVPDYRSGPIAASLWLDDPLKNKSYYRDFAEYLGFISLTQKTHIAVRNASSVTAMGVRIKAEVLDESGAITVTEEGEAPVVPSTSFQPAIKSIFQGNRSDVLVTKGKGKWIIDITMGKIQPKATEFTRSCLYVGASESTRIKVRGLVYADNLPLPLEVTLDIVDSVSPVEYSPEEITRMADGCALGEGDRDQDLPL